MLETFLRIVRAVVTPIATAFAVVGMSSTRVGRTISREPEEVGEILSDYINGQCRRVVWFGFTSTEIENMALESIRQRATKLEFPSSQNDRVLAKDLLEELETLKCS